MEIILNDGQIAKLDTKLNIKKLLMINKDFNTDEFATLTMNTKKEEEMTITLYQGLQAIYISYRQANMTNFLPFDDFVDNYTFDMSEALEAYTELLFTQKKNDSYKQSVEKAIKKK
ncbi:hypothetical protein [Carnobacterium inhibens]|uniref:hypothetical protein n=1 Tax=Carnobacterium inhibens TaxID=147709 RepID=UPI0005566800|nr:hypothetical protein [Carnobacterium inhibens]